MTDRVEEMERAAAVCERIRLAHDEGLHAATLLDPLNDFFGADMGAFRVFSVDGGGARLTTLLTAGIPDRVNDAYLNRYIALDPARWVLRRQLTEPLLANRARPGYRLSAPPGPAGLARADTMPDYRQDFVRYRDEFLLPNRLSHHLGFCFQDRRGQHTFLFDFHRAPGSAPFQRLEFARARIAAILLHAQSGEFHAAGEKCGMFPLLLSRREREVADAVTLGLANKEIAARMGITVRTVENHLRSIFAKTGVSSRTRLAARMHGVLPHVS
jgi:DNA-binding CsgD family transcriptional regulator